MQYIGAITHCHGFFEQLRDSALWARIPTAWVRRSCNGKLDLSAQWRMSQLRGSIETSLIVRVRCRTDSCSDIPNPIPHYSPHQAALNPHQIPRRHSRETNCTPGGTRQELTQTSIPPVDCMGVTDRPVLWLDEVSGMQKGGWARGGVGKPWYNLHRNARLRNPTVTDYERIGCGIKLMLHDALSTALWAPSWKEINVAGAEQRRLVQMKPTANSSCRNFSSSHITITHSALFWG